MSGLSDAVNLTQDIEDAAQQQHQPALPEELGEVQDIQGDAEDVVDGEPISEQQVTVESSTSLWEFFTSSAINLVLPFINGMMLGFGELLAHEIGFKFHWRGAKAYPVKRMVQRQRETQNGDLRSFL